MRHARRPGVRAALAALAIPTFLAACAPARARGASEPAADPNDPRSAAITLDAEEAEAVLAILDGLAAGRAATESEWNRVERSDAYKRLARREASMGRAIAPADFRARVAAEPFVRDRAELRATLDAWRRADLDASARRVRAFLPPDATIRVVVFPVIKPAANSFVFEPSTNPAIFLSIDPNKTAAQFENMVAHELHHIGLANIPKGGNESTPELARASDWLGAFGEGMAMLAAAGGAAIHPHAASPAEDRERWDRDVAHAAESLPGIERFFLGILDGRLATDDAIAAEGMPYFGETQGPWYTLGWILAATIEQGLGREALLDTMRNPLELPATYERAARILDGRGGLALPAAGAPGSAPGRLALPHFSAAFLARLPAHAATAAPAVK
jgi:hypothetical protein